MKTNKILKIDGTIVDKKQLENHLQKIASNHNLINKPSKETIEEKEQIKSYIDIIDRQGLKQLTSALKDLNDILSNKNGDNNTQSLADVIQKAYESKIGEENAND